MNRVSKQNRRAALYEKPKGQGFGSKNNRACPDWKVDKVASQDID
jgi:hypothetical protein